ncbi:MAG: hypothetical protein WCX22_01885 [Methanoregula sp.]
MAGIVQAYPKCPTLAWMIAHRVCNPYEESDAFISFVGRKGSGKSTSSIAFCEGLAEDIARIRGKGEDPSAFFGIDNIKSITERGAIDLLSSGALKQENSVFLLDDTGTQWGSRNFQSPINKYLNAILQICRVYRCVLVANFIMKNHIDVQARGMTDYRAEMLYKDVTTGQAFFKFFYLENNEYGEYKKYLTWHGKRIKTWIIEKPSDKLNVAYKTMRRENTDQFIEDARIKVDAKLNPKKKTDGRIKDYASLPVVIENKDRVKALKAQGMRVEGIVGETGLTRYWVQRCLSVR